VDEHTWGADQGKDWQMKVSEFRGLLKEAAEFYRAQRNEHAAEDLADFTKLFDGNDKKTVDALVKQIVAAYKSADEAGRSRE
jgi:hypothetical protein